MNQKLLFLLTRTPLHVGAGDSVGAIDQPIVRERPTGFPVIPGSSLKGVLRDVARQRDAQPDHEESKTTKSDFGTDENAGFLSIGEARILAFPIRSARGSFALVTCSLALERFARVLRETRGPAASVPVVPPPPADLKCLASDTVILKRDKEQGVVLEEYRFEVSGAFPAEWEKLLLSSFGDPVWKHAAGRLVLLSDGDFSHFVRAATEVSQHVGIDPETGTAKTGVLFNLEAVPAETLFHAVISSSRGAESLDRLKTLLEAQPVLQIGGDGSTGLGYCSVQLS